MVSLNNAEQQLKNQSLPLSLDNIYTVIQQHVIEPYLVSSMMANDTFLQDWIAHEESEQDKIEKYLSSIKNKYSMFTTFLVSEKSGNYYTHDGYIETVSQDNPNNHWYYSFINNQAAHEINLDFNEHISNSMIMFINYKIFTASYDFLGAVGVGLKISYIDDMLKSFRVKHHFKVIFVNKEGKIVLAERNIVPAKNIDEIDSLKELKDRVISKEPAAIEYEKDGYTYLLNTKYIPELDLYLIVEAKLNDFTDDVEGMYYITLFLSLLISLFILAIFIYLIRNYNQKLEFLAGNDQLTNLNNRRSFEDKLQNQLNLSKRDKSNLCLLFLDVDNFKRINDRFGHAVGDQVLSRIAHLLQENLRKTDLLARWGGEEFIIAYLGSQSDNAMRITEKLRLVIENDHLLKTLSKSVVTVSFGLTELREEDTMDSLISRADNAMYEAKSAGKNRIHQDML